MDTALACPTCGRSADADPSRFCGGCGELLRPRGAGPAETAQPPETVEPVERPEELVDASSRRRVVLAVVLVVALVVAVTVALRDPVEVVTADGLGTASGRTSNLAVTDLSTEHWRLDLLPAMEQESFGWVQEATRSGNRLVAVGGRTTVFDLDRGTLVGRLPAIEGTPLLEDGLLVVVVRDRLLEIEPEGGTVVGETVLGLDVAARPVFPVPVDGGYLVVGSGRVSFLAPDGEVRWQIAPSLDTNFAAEVAEGSVVLSDHLDTVVLRLEDGSTMWETDGSDASRHPARGPVVADGLLHTVELHHRAGEPGMPVTDVPTARDLSTGEVVWQADAPVTAELLGVRDGVVFVTSQLADPRLQRLEAATGRLLPPLPYDGPDGPPGTALLGPDGLLLVNERDGGLVALEDDSGAPRWRTDDGGAGGITVTGDLVLLSGRGQARVLDGRDGAVLHRLPPDPSDPPAGIAIDGRVAMVAPGFAVDVADGSIRLHEPAAQRWSRPVALPGGFVVTTQRGTVVLDANGAERWSLVDQQTGWREPVAIVDGRLVVVGGGMPDGGLELLDRHGERVGEPLADHPLWGAVVVDDLVVGGRLWYRQRAAAEDELVAVRVTSDGPELEWTAERAGGQLLADGEGIYEVTVASITRRDLEDGAVVATASLPRLVDAQRVALHDGVLVAGAGQTLLGIDARSGDRLWERELSARITGGPSIAGAVVYVGTADGDVLLFGMDGAPLTSRDAAADPVRDVVAAHGLVLVVTDREAFALGPETLPDRARDREPNEIGTVDVPVP